MVAERVFQIVLNSKSIRKKNTRNETKETRGNAIGQYALHVSAKCTACNKNDGPPSSRFVH